MDQRFVGSNPDGDDEFFRAIKNCNITSFTRDVKLSVLCCMISWHVKEPYRYERETL
jgi:hypothetical protein